MQATPPREPSPFHARLICLLEVVAWAEDGGLGIVGDTDAGGGAPICSVPELSGGAAFLGHFYE